MARGDPSLIHEEYGSHGEEIEAYLDDIHGDVSRTFEAALTQLEDDELRREVRDSYLLCRIADTIEDTSLFDGETKAELLNSYSDLLEKQVSGDAEYRDVAGWVRTVSDNLDNLHINEMDGSREYVDESYWSLVRNAHTVFSSYEQFDGNSKTDVGESIIEMAEGMAEYVARDEEGIRIRDDEDLHEYCHYAAGTVGELLTDLFADKEDVDKEVLEENSEAYAQLLQRINVARDPVADIRKENAIFTPETFLERFEHDDFKKEIDHVTGIGKTPSDDSELVNSLEKVLNSAEQRADSAIDYITEFSESDDKGIRAYLETPLLLALATAHQNEPSDAFSESGLKIGRQNVGRILGSAGNISDEEWQDKDQLLKNILERPEN